MLEFFIIVDGDIFTGILYDHYTSPAEFCFDEESNTQCRDPPLDSSCKIKKKRFI